MVNERLREAEMVVDSGKRGQSVTGRVAVLWAVAS